MKNALRLGVVLFFLGLAVQACAYGAGDMSKKASALDKLTRKVDSYQAEFGVTPGMSVQDLLYAAAGQDSELLRTLGKDQVHVTFISGNAVLLLCTGDGRHALLENSACTPRFDRQLWRDEPGAPCRFTITRENVCDN
ncbi:hypothetical protein [Desulfovibrio aminophilus]|uniref:hypothetical protein n=1 Tax=Desulfovibrio aminophilus TaxID=81425 RepID=UPI003390BD49